NSATTFELSKPAGLAATRDGFLYVTELDRARVVQVAPDGTARRIAGLGPGFGDGDGQRSARFNQPASVALAPDGSLLVADAANYLVRRVSPTEQNDGATTAEPDASRDARDGNQSAQVESQYAQNENQNARVGSRDADGANQVAPAVESSSPREVLPRIPSETFGDTFP